MIMEVDTDATQGLSAHSNQSLERDPQCPSYLGYDLLCLLLLVGGVNGRMFLDWFGTLRSANFVYD